MSNDLVRVFLLGHWMEISEEAYSRIEYARQKHEEYTGKAVTLDDILVTLVLMRLPPAPDEMN